MTNPLTDSRRGERALIDHVDVALLMDRASGVSFAGACAVACGWSLAKAAEKLHVSPTTLARKLKALAGKEGT